MRTVIAVALALALAAAACTSGGDPSPQGRSAPRATAAPSTAGATVPATDVSSPPDDAPPGIVRVQGCEPRSLLPADGARACGQQVLTALFSPLVVLDPVSGQPQWGDPDDDGVAASIRSIDARRWVVELEPDWHFHDGTPVTARSFVEAWNVAAYGPNGQANAFLFEPILGFEDLHCPEPGCEPVTAALDGLRVIDERTFDIVLRAPDRSFPRRLAHVAFAPLPERALEDLQGAAESAVGNGPFRQEGAWEHDQRIALRAVEDHPGGAPAVAGVDLVLVPDQAAAWQALQDGRIDVATALPAEARRPMADTGLQRVVREGDVYEALVVPTHVAALSEDDRLARALSMAIDRRRIIDGHLDGAARPARGLLPAVVAGDGDRCGRTCRFDPQAARDLLDAVGLPRGGIELWIDRSGTHEPWVRAIARQWRDHLGLGAAEVRVRALSHVSWIAHLQDQRVDGLYPTGWSMDVPSAEEYLSALHAPGGLFNFDGYWGVDVGARLAAAATAATDREAQEIHRRLEQDLIDDMHHVPLWVRTHEAVHTPRLAEVALDAKGRVVLDELVLADPEG